MADGGENCQVFTEHPRVRVKLGKAAVYIIFSAFARGTLNI